jgi:hypothetical protein
MLTRYVNYRETAACDGVTGIGEAGGESPIEFAAIPETV